MKSKWENGQAQIFLFISFFSSKNFRVKEKEFISPRKFRKKECGFLSFLFSSSQSSSKGGEMEINISVLKVTGEPPS